MLTVKYTGPGQKDFLFQLCEKIPEGSLSSLALALETRANIAEQERDSDYVFSPEQYAAIKKALDALPGIKEVLAILLAEDAG